MRGRGGEGEKRKKELDGYVDFYNFEILVAKLSDSEAEAAETQNWLDFSHDHE
ncbi:MAG: hypothetical protein QNK33_07675 [Bacteroidales bacterium]|nr:hypothetical protein [Bacteroidales bacterium]